ncbi:MAG: 3-keto-5-aminohexanoate cleavage protein [Dehalococcoidales bacterium]|nr:3-keto-5-aminohexanoate cleavage protein [Dehalococcoidales bacterium]
MEKVIITCAVTGSIVVPTQTPYLPITPEQIADEAVKACEAGAASVHIHVRNPEDGRPSSKLELYEKVIKDIKNRSNVIVGITSGGSPEMNAEQRIEPARVYKPELASFNLGPVCTNASFIAKKYKDSDYKFAWEKDFLRLNETHIMQNSYRELDIFAKTLVEANTKPECECWDISQIYNAAFYYKQELLKPPVWLQFVTGPLGAIGSHYSDILHLKNTAERLFGAGNYHWSLIATGLEIFNVAPLAIMLGGNIRVGFEDNIYIEKGKLAKSNAEMVERIVRVVKDMGREVATPDEARTILGLKGKDKVNY